MPQHIDPAIAARIDGVIQLREMSYADLARRVDVTPATAWNWAKARCAVSLERLADIATALDVSPAYIAFGLSDDAPVRDPFNNTDVLPEGMIEIPEYRYEATPEPLTVAAWRVPKAYVSKVLRTESSRLLIFENRAKIGGDLNPGDRVIVVTQCAGKEALNEGYYLIFHPFTPDIVRLTSLYDDGIKYYITKPNFAETQCVAASEITIIGEVVGTMQRVSLDF